MTRTRLVGSRGSCQNYPSDCSLCFPDNKPLYQALGALTDSSCGELIKQQDGGLTHTKKQRSSHPHPTFIEHFYSFSTTLFFFVDQIQTLYVLHNTRGMPANLDQSTFLVFCSLIPADPEQLSDFMSYDGAHLCQQTHKGIQPTHTLSRVHSSCTLMMVSVMWLCRQSQ